MNSDFAPWIWLLAVVVLIPPALWLLRRTSGLRLQAGGAMRTVGQLPLSTSQRLLAVEVGSAEGRRWLVLGVTPSTISLLANLEPPSVQAAPGGEPAAAPVGGFARVLDELTRARTAGKAP